MSESPVPVVELASAIPCPFCGGKDIFGWVPDMPDDGKPWVAQCKSCDAATGYQPTLAEAADAWNKRVIS